MTLNTKKRSNKRSDQSTSDGPMSQGQIRIAGLMMGVLVFERSEARVDARFAELAHVVVEARVVHADGLLGGAVGNSAEAQLLPGGREHHLQMCNMAHTQCSSITVNSSSRCERVLHGQQDCTGRPSEREIGSTRAGPRSR